MKEVQPIRDKEKIEAVKDVLKRSSYRDWFLFTLGINTGLRVGDLLKLKVKDVKGKTHLILVEQKTENTRKSRKTKRFRLNNNAQELIEEYTERMKEDDWLFPSRLGDKAISRVQAYRILNKAAKEVGLTEIGTHTMRKTFGYHFYQKTKDATLLQEIFGHSAPSVTLRYIGINQDIIDKAIDNFSL